MKFKIVYFILLLFFFGCNKNETTHYTALSIPQYCDIENLSLNFKLNRAKSKNGFLYIEEEKGKIVKKHMPISIKFKKVHFVNTLKLILNSDKDIKYTLYINGEYSGRYRAGEKLGLKRKLKSLRIVLGKTASEIAIRAWYREKKYKMFKDTLNYTQGNKVLEIKLQDTVQFRYPVIRKINGRNKTKFGHVDFASKIIINDIKSGNIINQTACFYPDNSFYIEYFKVGKNNKIEYNYNISGTWKPISQYRGKTKIKLRGKFEGKHKKNEKFKSLTYNKNIIIDSLSILHFDDLSDKIMLDLPNQTMVNIRDFHKYFVVALPYYTTENFTHTKLYDCNECYLRYETIKDLIKAQAMFMQMGFRLKMLDCYRPYHIQRKLFEAFPVPGYVADPVGGSVHNKGSAVDLTLVDTDGKELDMGTEFDDLSRKSNPSYTNFPDTVLNNRCLLFKIMRANNFTPIRSEWWHYNHKNARRYPKIDDAFPCE